MDDAGRRRPFGCGESYGVGDGIGGLRAAVVLAVAAVSLAVAPASGGGCTTQRRLPDGWTRIAAPTLSEGQPSLTTYDVSDHDVDKLVVTNGTALAASADGGCTWHDSTLPPDLPLPDPSPSEQQLTSRSISQVRFAIGSASHVWAIGDVNLVVGGVVAPRPRVLLSQNGGVTFESRIEGLPTVGRPIAIRGVSGALAYLLFEVRAPGVSYALYETKDSGLTWQRRWGQMGKFDDLAIDAFAGFRLWLWGERGVYRGLPTDPAPTGLAGVSGPVSAVDIDGSSGIVRVFLESGGERFISYDSGATFGRLPAPEGVDSASSFSWQPGLSILALSSLETNVLVEPPLFGAVPVDYSPHEENVSGVQFVATLDEGGFPLYTFSPSALYLRIVPYNFVRPPDRETPGIDVDVRRPPLEPPTASITPTGGVVSLRPGQRRTVDYTIALPPVPTPLDVFFMTDSTGSMSTTIASVQDGVQEIVDSLGEAGIDVFFGVADFRDYPETPADTANHPYRLHRKVGPINSRLAAALEGITTGGGTSDGDDSALEAIYQAATGAGRMDPLLARGELIAPGQDAGFRGDSMKVILVASDDGMRQPQTTPGYPGPSLAAVEEALVERGIYLVGLEVDTSTNDTAREEMEFLANATKAVAPPEGLDCDGDGGRDIPGGGPLVCEFDPDAGSYVADAFVGMLSGIEDIAAIDLSVTAKGRVAVPRGVLHHPAVNVKKPHTFTLPVEFRCTARNAGTKTPVRIAARSRGTEIVSTTATLDCVAPEPPEPVVIPPFVALPVVVPPAAPLAPISHPQPPVNTNPNPQLNPQGGLAAQEDQEFQLALANTDGVVLDDEEMAMTGLARSGPPLPALAWATAFAMTAAAAFGLHRSRRTSPAPVRLE